MCIIAILIVGLLVGTTTADSAASPQQSTKLIVAKAMDDHECDPGEWHFVITSVRDLEAPASIAANWSNGSSASISLGRVTGGVAHYTTTAHLSARVIGATAHIALTWSGQFNLSHGPCGTGGTTTGTGSATSGGSGGGTTAGTSTGATSAGATTGTGAGSSGTSAGTSGTTGGASGGATGAGTGGTAGTTSGTGAATNSSVAGTQQSGGVGSGIDPVRAAAASAGPQIAILPSTSTLARDR
jgi:hypothetical protein